jgi:hypothetical protein
VERLRRARDPTSSTVDGEVSVRTFGVVLPEIAFVAATRGMAGAGIGLLLGDRLPADTRRAIGWTLLAIGVLTTIPIAIEVRKRSRSLRGAE